MQSTWSRLHSCRGDLSLVPYPLSLVIQFAQLALVGWLPGAAVFRLPWLNRDARASLDAEERGFWAVVLSASLSLAIVIAYNRILTKLSGEQGLA